jgi:NAD(P)-dependent dehydrogenase (short-subunit alcohol dehydrogenase family)
MPDGTVIVTGASMGIGAAVAVEIDRRGFAVVGLSQSGTAPVGRAITCDVTDEERVRVVLAEVAAEETIVGLVNNAGLYEYAPSAELETARYEHVMRINATSQLIVSREVYPYLVNAGGGRIVNMGSFFDKLGVAGNVAYCSSKAAVAAMTRCLAVEWAADGIMVVNVAPGYIETDMNEDMRADDRARTWLERRIPMARTGKPEEVAALIGALMSDEMTFLTGETIYIDGAQGLNQ